MNQDQIKGELKKAAGKVQEGLGNATGNEKQEAKGESKQVEGHVQKSVGNIKDTFNK
jgi:uncharacterized protein YjbJ (UPF0337 family)